MPEISTLDLSVLGQPPGLPALSIAQGAALAEAAGVCLEECEHSTGAVLRVIGMAEREYRLYWPKITTQIFQTHFDEDDATRDGACCIAILVARELTGLAVLLKSRKWGGFDYWIGNSVDDLFQGASRLEVSGIRRGDESQIRGRLGRKKKQTEQSDSIGLPAFACVVEFSRPEAHFVKR